MRLQLEQVRSFDGDKTKLGNAEKFFLLLGDLPQYKVRTVKFQLKESFLRNESISLASLSRSDVSRLCAGSDRGDAAEDRVQHDVRRAAAEPGDADRGVCRRARVDVVAGVSPLRAAHRKLHQLCAYK